MDIDGVDYMKKMSTIMYIFVFIILSGSILECYSQTARLTFFYSNDVKGYLKPCG